MTEGVALSVGRRRVCRWLGYAFGVAGGIKLLAIAVAAVAPAFLATHIQCTAGACAVVGAPLSFLPDTMRVAVAGMAGVGTMLDAYLAAPAVRIKLMLAETLISLPIVCMLLAVAIALLELARGRGGALARALPWLRRAAGFALLSVPLVVLGNSIQTTVMMQAFRPGRRFYLSAEVERGALHLLLALVALAVTWALAAGIKAEQDLAEIV